MFRLLPNSAKRDSLEEFQRHPRKKGYLFWWEPLPYTAYCGPTVCLLQQWRYLFLPKCVHLQPRESLGGKEKCTLAQVQHFCWPKVNSVCGPEPGTSGLLHRESQNGCFHSRGQCIGIPVRVGFYSTSSHRHNSSLCKQQQAKTSKKRGHPRSPGENDEDH